MNTFLSSIVNWWYRYRSPDGFLPYDKCDHKEWTDMSDPYDGVQCKGCGVHRGGL